MRELPQAKPDGFASSLWEGASGAPANFALQPETLPLCQRPHLRGRLPPLRGKMSPQVTKRGICRRRRLGEFRQEPLQSLLRKASSPKGAPLGYAGNFAATAEAVPLGMLNSLRQNLTVLPAPSGREPLARPQTLHFNRKLCRYAKGPILEGAGCDQREQTGGVQPTAKIVLPSGLSGLPLKTVLK